MYIEYLGIKTIKYVSSAYFSNKEVFGTYNNKFKRVETEDLNGDGIQGIRLCI